METNEKKTRKIDIDGNVIWHRMNEDGTVTLYCDGPIKKALPRIAENAPTFFNIMTDPEDDGPLMVIVDPKKVAITVDFGIARFGFSICDPCEDDCAACENRETCEASLVKKEKEDPEFEVIDHEDGEVI